MADPVTAGLALGSMAMTAVGGIVSAEGAAYQGRAQQAQYGYQAAIADMNARLAKADAQYAMAAGQKEAQDVGLRGRQISSEITNRYAAGNIDPTTGSARNVAISQHFANAANINTTLANAAKRAYGYGVTAAEDTAQGRLYQLAGQTAKTAAGFNVASSLLTAGSGVSSKWMQGQQQGLFTMDGGATKDTSSYYTS